MKGIFNKLFGGSTKNSEITEEIKPQKILWSPINYNLLFDSASYDNQALTEKRVGELLIESGYVIASDPFFLSHMEPFNKPVPNGQHPVDIVFVELENAGKRVGVSRLKFSTTEAVKWELAVTDKDDTSELTEDGYIGYPVDAGLGCFIDANFSKTFDKVMDQHYKANGPDSNYYDDVLAFEFKNNAFNQNDPNDIGDYVNHNPIKESSQNVTIFSSGVGDGSYPSYWGIDSNGQTCELITDFLIINPLDEKST
uniref:DUF4241 domain-containing protein n=1 Tax=Roseivirga sp. TaxID=1964215 RepID=UPI004047629E